MASPVVWGTRFVLTHLLTYWLEHGGLDIFDDAQEDANIEGRKLVMVFERNGDTFTSSRDTEMCTSHWIHASPPWGNGTWDDAAYPIIEAAVETFWAANIALFPDSIGLTELRWYANGPDWAPVGSPPVSPPSPVLRTVHVSGAEGTNASIALPPQMACNLTFRTASRRHWGRMALPAPASGALTHVGRMASADVAALAESWAEMSAVLGAGGLVQTVYSPTGLSFLGITDIECDDVLDVQRRRRFASTGHRTIVATA